ARLGRAVAGVTGQLRSGERNKRPALGALLAVPQRRPAGDLALAAVENAHMAARERDIDDVVAVDVDAAGTITGRRHFVDLRERCRFRVRLGRVESDHIAREAERRAPHRTVLRAWRGAVEADLHAAVL